MVWLAIALLALTITNIANSYTVTKHEKRLENIETKLRLGWYSKKE